MKQQNIVIILVAPQMGENIGAVARAMKNFDIVELRIVTPRDGWPNERAISMAVGAADILNRAKIYPDLPRAIADLECVYATTSASRSLNKNYILSTNLNEQFLKNLKVGIMFGRENCGLNNDEITLANKIITIDTNVNFSSLNIAQAVLIVCYELFRSRERSDLQNIQKLATQEELEYFFEHLFTELDKKNFFKTPEKKPKMTKNIKNIFTRIDKLSQNELQTLRGIIANLSL